MIVGYNNVEWMILMARIKEFPEVAKENLGYDVTDEDFDMKLQELVEKRKRVVYHLRSKAQ